MILAPLTRGGNLPFRRLCADFGMQVSMGEMVFARHLLKGDPIERARLRRAPNEQHFGVQIATNDVEEGITAMQYAQKLGADFVDLNCGCPIHEATRRGLGSSLLRSPPKLGKLVRGMTESNVLPLSVKIRLGCEADTITVQQVVEELIDAGAAAVTIHGRTAQQRYSKAADWNLIEEVVRTHANSPTRIPIVGNGDILTHYEARRRLDESGVDAVMVGRGALIKPWIFKEFNDQQSWEPDVNERIAVYRTLACYMKDHFGNDAMGRKRSNYFFPWHFEFLCRYQALPEADFGSMSLQEPLLQRRVSIDEEALEPIERLLSHRSNRTHALIANALWESDSDSHAVALMHALAESPEFEAIRRDASGEGLCSDDEDTELGNVPSAKREKKMQRRGRNPKPPRSDEEIVVVRAERAAKKERLEQEQQQKESQSNAV
jgi:tRNA-dihydrouridine synthase 3